MVMLMATKTDIKERIMESAMKLWQQTHDVNKVSLTDVAEAAGVSPTTVYNNFGTREGLVEQSVRYLMGQIIKKQQDILKTDLPFPAKMQRMIAVRMDATEGMRAELLDKICTLPALRKYVDQTIETEVKPMMKGIITQGKREGYIRTDVPEEVIMLYFDMLQAAGRSCIEEMRKVVGDKQSMLSLARLIYFGLFQKEFDLLGEGSAAKM